MNRDIIKNKVINVIEESLNIKFLSDTEFQYSMLDPRIGLKPRDLLVIFFELQDSFHIKFVEDDIVDSRFDFLDNIVDSIYIKELEKDAKGTTKFPKEV